MNLSYRPATAADHDFALATHHAAYEEAATRQFGSWELTRQDEFFEASWDAGRTTILLADGERRGYCVIEERPDSIQIQELVIHPAHQGAGIGTSVLRRTQTLARARGIPIRLGTFHTNRARVLYERVGFVVFDETPTHVLMEWLPETTDADPSV